MPLTSNTESPGPQLFILTRKFCASVRANRQPQQTVARAGHIAPCDFSRYLHGTPFGPRTRRRVEFVGAVLGLAAEACTEPFVDPVFGCNGAQR